MQHAALCAASGTISFGDVAGAFSYALDLTEGQPAGHAVRCCYIAGRVAERLGADPAQTAHVHYTALLKDLGCSSNAARIAELYLADDRTFKRRWKTVPPGLPSTLRFVFRETGASASWTRRIGAVANILRHGDEIAQDMILARCTRGAEIARSLRRDEAVAQGIYHLDEHWNGTGRPDGLTGQAIPLGARLALLAQVADVFHQTGGRVAAQDEVARRAGTWLDPEAARAFASLAEDEAFWRDLESPLIDALVAARAPVEDAPVDDDWLDAITLAFGQVIDAKSPYTAGHSGRVARYAEDLARQMGVPADRIRPLRRAAALHDIGKLGVSSAVLDKPGTLTEAEWVEMREHAAHTNRILGRIGVLSDMADLAAAHHERLDGTGYPLGLRGEQIRVETRIITTCDFYDALTADRPYRAAMPRQRALEVMAAEVGRAVDPACFAALTEVLESG
ncbi:HD domain-containing protein [Erythrobacteraceae bacterium CFH 75059]|uniref:HD-GYP domain-containing protein n=1 Tax=Qipengyuania thermophila TaxID=2509361 RepID=UPI0010219B8D|nr:HD domain-containing protein [Qipengyuania thermophila]TCD06945.1 HD domain-containing protein [Erythrobacteraceae bacterium CFH 75059]